MPQYYVGLDVHSRQSAFVIEDHEGRVIAQGEVSTTPAGFEHLRATYDLPPGTPVALETGTVAFFAARQLVAVGLTPVVVDAHEVRLKAHRPLQKSDRRDAFELCEGLRRGSYRAIVHVPPPAVLRLRETLARRRPFVRLQTAQVCAVKALLRGAGLGHLSRSLGSEVGWAKVIGTLSAYPELRSHVAQHRAMWRCAREQVATLDTDLAQQQRATFRDALRRLQTIPGVGPIVASTALAVFSDVTRLPRCETRGELRGPRPGDVSVGGPRCLRAHHEARRRGAARDVLRSGAHSRPAHPLHPYFASLCARRGYKLAVIAVAHRLCRITFAMLRDGRDFDLSKLAVERGPFEHKVVRLYRRKRRTLASR